MLHTFAALVDDKPGVLMRAALAVCMLLPTLCEAQPAHQLKIKIINAKTNQPITDEHLNVALRVDQIGSVAMATDKNGIILVDYGHATIIRILANMYGDCRPRGELYTNYSIDTILKTGITAGNLCSSASPAPKPGVLLLYEIPKTFIRNYPNPPRPAIYPTPTRTLTHLQIKPGRASTPYSLFPTPLRSYAPHLRSLS